MKSQDILLHSSWQEFSNFYPDRSEKDKLKLSTDHSDGLNHRQKVQKLEAEYFESCLIFFRIFRIFWNIFFYEIFRIFSKFSYIFLHVLNFAFDSTLCMCRCQSLLLNETAKKSRQEAKKLMFLLIPNLASLTRQVQLAAEILNLVLAKRLVDPMQFFCYTCIEKISLIYYICTRYL